MKIVWLLYQQEDLSANRDYARLMRENGLKRDMKIETVLTRDLTLLLDENGTPSCLRKGRKERPDAVIARMREPLYSRHFERMGVPVFNGSEVCRICNDKRQTLQFLSGLPMPRTTFLTPFTPMPQDGPVIVKPACSHGGDRVELVETQFQWNDALEALQGEPGEFVAVVRKAKDKYFLGATTNEESRTLTIPLDFLEKDKKYHAVIYADGEDADWKTNPTSYQIKDKEVTAADTLSVVMAKGGGQAVSFIPITD